MADAMQRPDSRSAAGVYIVVRCLRERRKGRRIYTYMLVRARFERERDKRFGFGFFLRVFSFVVVRERDAGNGVDVCKVIRYRCLFAAVGCDDTTMMLTCAQLLCAERL